MQWICPPHILTYTQFFYLICFDFGACRPIELSAHLIEYIEKVSEASFIWNKGNILQIYQDFRFGLKLPLKSGSGNTNSAMN